MAGPNDDDIIIQGHKSDGSTQSPPNYVSLPDAKTAYQVLNASSQQGAHNTALAIASAYQWVTGNPP